jgi:hypothetical protein
VRQPLLVGVVGIPHRPDATFAIDVEAGCPTRLPIGIMRGGHPVLDCPPEAVLRTAQLLPFGVGCHDGLGVGQFAFAVSFGCDGDGHCVCPCVGCVLYVSHYIYLIVKSTAQPPPYSVRLAY